MTNSKEKVARSVTRRSVRFSLFFFPGESSDGTGAEIACPTAAAGGGVGAERTGSDRATSQSRGEKETKQRLRIKMDCRVKGT